MQKRTIHCIPKAMGTVSFTFIVSTEGIRWILWFNIHYAAAPAMLRDFGH